MSWDLARIASRGKMLRDWLCEARRKRTSRRLADQIVLASLALTLGLLSIFGAAGYVALRQSEMRRTQALLESAAGGTRYEIERTLSGIENLIAGAAGQALVSNALSDARHGDDLVYPFLRDTVRAHPEVASIALINYRGDVVSAFGNPFSPGVSMANLASSVSASASAQTQFLTTERGARMVRAYPVVYLPTGNIEGAIVAEVITEKLLPGQLKIAPMAISVKLLAGSGLPIAARGAGLDGDTLRVEMPITSEHQPAGQAPMRLITETPRGEAFATLQQLQRIYAAMVLVAIATSVYFSRQLGSRIANPIVALRNAAHAATEQGHAALQGVPVFGEGEVGDLAQSFNDMCRALQEAHAELEQRVDLRTRELREARERIKNIFDSVAEVIYSTGPDFSVMQFVSAAAQAVLGLAPSRLTSEPGLWLSIIHPDDRAAVEESHRAGLSDDGAETDYRIVRPDGGLSWVRERFTVQRDADTGQIMRINGTVIDITAAVQADQARRRAEEVLRTLHRAIQSSSSGVIISDSLQPDNPVIMVNPAFERITGYRQDEVIGKNCRFLQGPDTSGAEIDKLKRAIAEQRECKVILKNYRKDGIAFWNELSIAPVEDGSGRITQFVGIMNEITTLVNYQNQIIEWGERLDAIFTLSPDGFVSLDDQHKINFANPAIERMTGIPGETLLGMEAANFDRTLRALAHPSHAYPALDTERPIDDDSEEDLLYLTKPEPKILKRIARRAHRGKVSTIIYFHDVTREMEVDRLKSEFLSTAAHELRTPMASVMGFSELLLNREFPRGVQLEYLEIINRQSKRLTSLLNDLLDLARIEARRRGALIMGHHRLDEIVRDAVAALMMPGDTRAVEIKFKSPLPVVEADAAKIQQALTNLLSNAYKYSPHGGTITVESCERTVRSKREIGICIRDRGMGMTSVQLSRAFERFFRADDTGAIPGTGLGLSLVKEIVETHGGEVQMESEFGKGTTATLWLPLPESDVQPTALPA